MFRFSGLPNNAQLEMVEATKKRTDAAVMIQLQLETGDRQSGQFMPDTTVQQMLDALCPDRSCDADVVVVYMRTEVHGDALAVTTLKSLGLTGGRAMMRMIHCNPDQLKV